MFDIIIAKYAIRHLFVTEMHLNEHNWTKIEKIKSNDIVGKKYQILYIYSD